MSSKVEVILNSSSGSVSDVETLSELKRIFEEHGIAARIHIAKTGEELRALAKKAVRGDSDAVVAGGGDGTVSTVASALIGTNKALGVLPLGTLNNFSKDIQIPP